MKNRSKLLVAILPVLACFAFLPGAQAQLSPPPDGCYPNFTTAEGCDALSFLTTGAGNTALGWRSLFSTTDGSFNTGVGGGALLLNTGSSNTAVGAAALLLNTTASNSTAVGTDTLVNNAADDNTATGAFALSANTTGGTLETVAGVFEVGPNTAVGSHALERNVDGSANTAMGYNTLHSQVSGQVSTGFPQFAANTAVGFEALANVTGSAGGENALNTAFGYQALFDFTDGTSNVAVGALAGTGLTSGIDNIYIGTGAGAGLANESNHTYIQNINTNLQDFSAGVIDYVTVDLDTGLLGHTAVVSSQRYKDDIKPLAKSSEALFALKPVSFRLKKEYNPKQPLGFGLVAEEVEKVNPDLVYRNNKGQAESVRYEMVNAMLLNEFLKEHKKVEEQETRISQLKSESAEREQTIGALKKGMGLLTAQLKEQAAQIEKVSAQIAASRPAPRVVTNP